MKSKLGIMAYRTKLFIGKPEDQVDKRPATKRHYLTSRKSLIGNQQCKSTNLILGLC
jgi:hypothetical protein